MNNKSMVRVGTEGLYLNPVSGTYSARYKVHGVPTWKSLKTTILSQARIKLRELMVAVEKQRAADAPEGGAVTMGDCDRHIREQLLHSLQSERTKANYFTQLDAVAKHWPDGDYASTKPSSVTQDSVVRLRTALLKAKWRRFNTKKSVAGYSNAHVNQCLARLSNVLEIARLKGLCSADPFAQVSGLQGSVWLEVHSRKPDLPTKSEMERLFAEIAKVVPGDNEEPAFTKWRRDRATEASEHARFLAFSGMRLEEANRMTWADVIQQDGIPKNLKVRGFKKDKDGREQRQVKTKSSEREVPVVPAMRRLLAEIRARLVGAGQHVSGRILVPHTSLNAIRGACQRLGIARLKHHDMRHYFATICIEAGIPIPTIAAWLGHSDGGVLAQRVYGHLRKEHSAAAAELVNFDSPPPSSPQPTPV